MKVHIEPMLVMDLKRLQKQRRVDGDQRGAEVVGHAIEAIEALRKEVQANDPPPKTTVDLPAQVLKIIRDNTKPYGPPLIRVKPHSMFEEWVTLETPSGSEFIVHGLDLIGAVQKATGWKTRYFLEGCE